MKSFCILFNTISFELQNEWEILQSEDVQAYFLGVEGVIKRGF